MKNVKFARNLAITPVEFRRLQWTKGWALSLVGAVVYGILRLFGQTPKNYHGICPYFQIGNSWGGASFGWFFICCKDCSESLKYHEIGHGIQNAAVGGLTMLAYCIASAARYWWRELFGAKTSYDSWFFEGDATRLGTEYVRNIKKENKE